MPPLDAHNASDRAASKTARLEARITPDQKALLERAAALSGRTLREFVVSSAQRLRPCFDFTPFPERRDQLFLPMATIALLFQRA